TETCGAGSRMNLFKSTTVQTGPSNPSIAGYSYLSCHTDDVGNRALDAQYLFDNSMTVEKCAAFCANYTYFGTEYGTECYCGDSFVNPTSVASEGDCSFLCPGNSDEFCGAGDRLSVY
ncbi:WSC-domain-containing protein, partial [Mytilinidion resinicola]